MITRSTWHRHINLHIESAAQKIRRRKSAHQLMCNFNGIICIR